MVAPIVATASRIGTPSVGQGSPAAAASMLVATAQLNSAQPASCFGASSPPLNASCSIFRPRAESRMRATQ